MKESILSNKPGLILAIFTSIIEIGGELAFAFYMMYAADLAVGNIQAPFYYLLIFGALAALVKSLSS